MICLPVGIVISILRIYMKLYGFEPFTNKPYIYPLYTVTCLTILSVLLGTVFYWYDNAVDVATLPLVVSQLVASMVALIEAFTKRRFMSTVEAAYINIFVNIEQDFNQNIKLGQMWKRVNLKLSSISAVSTACLVLTFAIRMYQPNVRPLFWYSFIPKQALRIRSLQVITSLMIVSERLNVLDRTLQQAAEQNRMQTTHAIWMTSTDEEVRLVVALRTTYDRFYDVSILLNDCFGWSILTISISFFFEFVCNAYRIFMLTQKGGDYAKYAVDGAAIVSMGLLMTSMCWYAHQCFEKFYVYAFAFIVVIMIIFISNSFTDFIFTTLNIWLRLFAIIPLTTVSMVYELYIICWIIVLTAVLLLMFINNEMQDDYSIGSLVSCALFISQILSHMIALGESYFSASKLKELSEGFEQIDKLLKVNLHYTLDSVRLHKMLAQELLWIYVILLTDTIVMTYTHQATKNITILYWYSFLSSHALRLRCTQLIVLITCINVRLRVIKQIILDMVQKDAKNDTKTNCANMVALATDISIERVASLKMIYNQLYKMVNLVNDYFGWSLLSICTSYFIDFITNCYWIFVAKITNGPYEVYILNGGLVLSLVLQLTVICWHCQECETYSKYIGSSIFKLSKPLGNKRYNDLVSEFSLQALHQTFAVSAKDFFQLNLDLLGSMIGAIVTYLVILIQFMFTERSGSKISVPNSALSGAVSDVMLKNQTVKN